MLRKIRILLMFVGLALGTQSLAQETLIRVGSKPNTENLVLGQLIVAALKDAELPVEDRTNLGSSQVTRTALENGEIDVYAEYTGTAISNYFRGADIPEGVTQDADALYSLVSEIDRERNNLVWLEPSPANNTFSLAVTRTFAEANGLGTAADLAEYINAGNEVVLAANDEFAQRPDGLTAYEATYGFDLTDDQLLVIAGASSAQTEQALADGTNNVNVAMAYSTDGALVAYDFVVLTDPGGAQPVFEPAPCFRAEVLETYPEVPEVLNPIFASLTNEVLQELNAQVDVDGESPADVARAYLQENGFVE